MDIQNKKQEILKKFKNPGIILNDNYGKTIIECIATGMSEYEAIEILIELKIKQGKVINELSKLKPSQIVVMKYDE